MEKFKIVATIGFTSDFILRRVFDLGKDKVVEVIPVALDTDKDSRTRIEKAFINIENVLKTLDIKIHHLEFIKLEEAIPRGREILLRATDEYLVDLFLTGGPRILTTIMLLSALTLPESVASKVKITSYGEAFEGKISLSADVIISYIKLEEADKKILLGIKNLGKERVSGSELISALSMSKSTVYKKLRELEGKGLVKNIDRDWGLNEDLKQVV
ncbi:MAG: CRISPR locus-related DNA-binding protein [Sulfolobus sp.]|nr:CRISPR locus-related DNA-binding protein [Sulfolobus sp.]